MKRGTEHSQAKLTEDQVRQIKRMLLAGTQHTVIAKQLGTTRYTVGDIARRKSWRHIDA